MGQAAKKLEQPELLSTFEIARRLGISRVTTALRLTDLGYEPDASSSSNRKLYPFDEEMQFALEAARDTISATRIRDMRAAAQTKEFKLAVMREEYVPMEEVTDIVQRIVSNIYQEFTVRQPKRIANRLAKAKNVSAVKKTLKTDTDRIMKSLRENFERFIT